MSKIKYDVDVLLTCSEIKASLTLSELERILSTQRTPQNQLRLIRDARENYTDARDIAMEHPYRDLSAQDLRIAEQRAEQRRKREEELEDYGRC